MFNFLRIAMSNLSHSRLIHLRHHITNAYRMDETRCVSKLLSQISFSAKIEAQIKEQAEQFIITTRQKLKKQSRITALLHQYDLSSEEGIALMCLAEALLRIPDQLTIDKLIHDKLSTAHFKNHLKNTNDLFVNAATWSLIFTGSFYTPFPYEPTTLWSIFTHTMSRLGTNLARPFILKMMRIMGNQSDRRRRLRRAHRLRPSPDGAGAVLYCRRGWGD